MKRTVTILFLGLILFNICGYYLFFLRVCDQTESQTEDKIEQGKFGSQETMVLKSICLLPYQEDETGFMPLEPELQWHGQFFHAIKRHIIHDTLYTIYFLDLQKSRLYQKFNEAVKWFAETPLSNHTDLHISMQDEYLPLCLSKGLVEPPSDSHRTFCRIKTILPSPDIIVPGPPPKSPV